MSTSSLRLPLILPGRDRTLPEKDNMVLRAARKPAIQRAQLTMHFAVRRTTLVHVWHTDESKTFYPLQVRNTARWTATAYGDCRHKYFMFQPSSGHVASAYAFPPSPKHT